MKIVVTINNRNEAEKLIENGADILLAGINNYSVKMNNYLTKEEFIDLKKYANSLDKEVFLNANLLCHDDIVNNYKELFKEIDFDGIYIADVALIEVLENINKKDKVIYNPGTLITNSYDANYYLNQGIKAISLAKEITLEDIKFINSKKTGLTEALVHGHYTMYNTKRSIVENYFDFREDDKDYTNNKNIMLREEIRNEFYPILEEPLMTSIYREKATCMLKYVNELNLDLIRIDNIFKPFEYTLLVLSSYKEAVYLNEVKDIKDKIKENFDLELDEGFLFKKTIYKK